MKILRVEKSKMIITSSTLDTIYSKRAAVKLHVPDCNAIVCLDVDGTHSGSRIMNRLHSNEAGVGNALKAFFAAASEDVTFELLCASQDLKHFGIRTSGGFIFVFKGYALQERDGKRVSFCKLITAANETEMGRKFHFKDVAVELEEQHAWDGEGNIIV